MYNFPLESPSQAGLAPHTVPSSLLEEDDDDLMEGDLLVVLGPPLKGGCSLPVPSRNESLPLVCEEEAANAGPFEAATTILGDRPGASGSIRRTSSRTTAGRHTNPHHLPVSVRSRAEVVAASRVPGSSSLTSAIFRPWN